MSYDNPIHTSHTVVLTANQVDTSRKFIGPSGHRGRLVEVSLVPTATTVGTLTLQVGSGSNADEYGTLTVANGVTANTVKRASANGSIFTTEASVIPADSEVVCDIATAADTDDFAGELTYTFAWFK